MTRLRYFQGRRDVTAYFHFGTTEHPRPARITERALFTPDVATHLCEATPSVFIHVLDYDAEFDEDVDESVREEWYTRLVETWTPDDDYYVHHRNVVAEYSKDGPLTFGGWFSSVREQGEYDENEEDQAVEDALGNHYV